MNCNCRQIINSFHLRCSLLMLSCLAVTLYAGCYRKRPLDTYRQATPCQDFLQQIEYPDLCDESCSTGEELMTGPPLTVSNFEELEPWDLTLDECVLMALQGSKVMQRLGGAVVNSPQAVATAYDPALLETDPFQGVEAALSAFDTQFSTSFFYNHLENRFQSPFLPPGTTLTSAADSSTFQAQLQKQTASGATLTMRNQTDYNRQNFPPAGGFRNYTTANIVELRQPLGQNAGPLVNRIAGPNALPGQYNGVLIARIRGDLNLADFETAVRELVRDVETNYWELYFAYRDLHTKISAREAVRETWENRDLRAEGGLDRPDDEAQARQQYYQFETQVINALAGGGIRTGLVAAERNLRRLLGLPVADGRVIRPATDPVAVPIAFDWEDSQVQTLARRVELRRQKWVVRQRELELLAAKHLNRWRLDLVGQYGWRGFGDNLFGGNSAWDDLFQGDLDEYQVGIELGGPIGLRQAHLAVRNAELNLCREKVVMKEQQRQLLHDLSAAMVEVDRAYESMRANFNNRIAAEEELVPKQERFEGGEDQIFFLLDVTQRLANVESVLQRSLVDYNIALMEYARATGSLLSRYNITLTEGDWSDDAESKARVNAARLRSRGIFPTDGADKLSLGGYDQSTPGPQAFNTGLDSLYDEAPDLEGGVIEEASGQFILEPAVGPDPVEPEADPGEQ